MAKAPTPTPGQPETADELTAAQNAGAALTPEQQAIIDAAAAKAARAAELKAKRDDERAAREGESKADAFKRIAIRRMNSALDEIAKLKPLTATATYEYADEQGEKIVAALREEVDKVETAFKNKGVARKDSGFAL